MRTSTAVIAITLITSISPGCYTTSDLPPINYASESLDREPTMASNDASAATEQYQAQAPKRTRTWVNGHYEGSTWVKGYFKEI